MMPVLAAECSAVHIFVLMLLFFSPLYLFICTWSLLRRRQSKSSSPNPTDRQSHEENVTAEEKTTQSQSTKSELKRQPLRHLIVSTENSESADNSSKLRLRGANLNVEVSYKDRGSSRLTAIHEDKSNMIVPSQMSTEETLTLLKAMTDFKSNDSLYVKRCRKAPVTQKVVAYGVSDEITRRDRRPSFKEAVANNRDVLLKKPVKHKLEPLLVKLVMNGPRRFIFEYDELHDLLERGKALYASEPSLLEVPVPCVVYGDLHGQYSDLHRWLNLNGWPNQTLSAFLGDFVDRGSHGVEVVALITALKLTFPNRVFVIRGNHEEETLNRSYSFYSEVCQRFAGMNSDDPNGVKMYAYFKALFMQLPLAVIIGGRALGVHGGISPKLTSLQDIRNIKRPIDDFEVGTLECDLVWSDPDVDTKKKDKSLPFRPNLDREPNHGIGQLFSAHSVKKVCKRLEIDLIIRGHQTPLQGYAFFADGHMITLFSAPGYKGITAADVNMGAAIEFDKDMRMTLKKLKVSEQFRHNRIADCEQRENTVPAANLDSSQITATKKASDILSNVKN